MSNTEQPDFEKSKGVPATAPESSWAETVGEMGVGDTYFTFSHHLWVDADKKIWMFKKAPLMLEREKGGTVDMKIEMREDGLHVWTGGQFRLPKPTDEVPNYVGATKEDFIPVVEVH